MNINYNGQIRSKQVDFEGEIEDEEEAIKEEFLNQMN